MAMMHSNNGINIALDAYCAALNGGFLRFYDGTRPADPDTAITTQVQLASMRFPSPAFQAAVAGVASAYPLISDNATVAGTATWCRAFESDGVSVMFDDDVPADVVLNTVIITALGVLSVPESGFSFTIRFPKS